jgi:phage tail-like protein
MNREDPYRGYNFLITLLDSGSTLTSQRQGLTAATAGFSECSGLETTLEAEEYREGGRNDAVLRFPTRVTWANIRLRRGVTSSDELWRWHKGFTDGHGQRKDGMIVLQDDTHQAVKVWTFSRGLPVKWTGPSLDASRSTVAIEELDIAHEGLQLSEGQGGAAGAA